jgi:hypothetical protein
MPFSTTENETRTAQDKGDQQIVGPAAWGVIVVQHARISNPLGTNLTDDALRIAGPSLTARREDESSDRAVGGL